MAAQDQYNNDGYPQQNYNNNPQGYNYNQQGYNNQQGYGYNQQGYGYNNPGYDAQGYDPQGYDIEGYDRQGYDRQGYDRNGIDRNGYDRFGNYYNPYDDPQYQNNGYDPNIEVEPHIVKAIFAIILCFPFGIPALINAIRAKTLANIDIDSAFEASHSANKWGNIGIIVGIILNVLSFILTFCSDGYSPYNYYF